MKRALERHTLPLLFCTLLMGGCSTTPDAHRVEPSGFLEDYSNFREGEKDQAQLVYVYPMANFIEYDKIIIDPPMIWASRLSTLQGLDYKQRNQLAQYLHEAVRQELEKDYQIVTEPGPGTLRLRMAITKAKGSLVVLDPSSSIVPHGRSLSANPSLHEDADIALGPARFEAEMVDTQTGRRVMAAVDERLGAKTTGKMLQRWGDIHVAYDDWAQKLRHGLQRERQRDGATLIGMR
jgi:hypothetical protein